MTNDGAHETDKAGHLGHLHHDPAAVVAHEPLRRHHPVASEGGADYIKREVGEGREETAGVVGDSLSRQGPSRGRVAVSSTLSEDGNDSGRIAAVPGIELPLGDLHRFHGGASFLGWHGQMMTEYMEGNRRCQRLA